MYPYQMRCVTGGGLEVSKAIAFPTSSLCLVLVDWGINSQLLLQAHMPVAMLLTMMVIDSNPLKS